MGNDEKLDLILHKITNVEQNVSGLKQDVAMLKEDVSGLKQDVAMLKEDVSDLKQDVTGLQLHLENMTDKNISILAENHINLIEKLNQTISVADKEKVYQVQMSYLIERVEQLEKEMSALKQHIA